MRFIIGLLLGFFIPIAVMQAQQARTNQALPKVINVAQNSAVLEELSNQYQSSLFSASDTNFVTTINNWRGFIQSIEQYAEDIDFDIKGVKVWVKVFWAKDGNVDYIAYVLSDRSINIDIIEWEAFLRSFMRNNKLALKYKRGFTYDGRMMFPLSYRRPSQK
ncbi:MAG: hypothetical protein ACRBFS_13500 [Aureispira sp.]